MSLSTLVHIIFYTLFFIIVGMAPVFGVYLQKRKQKDSKSK
ncbi:MULTISPECIES: hypothetical protein [Staphylococcus]|nr:MULTISPECIES: hypothetical protein [Staphylococcus]WRV64765.1 hypothetical protein VQ623_00395 [Staphylococcus haemolyticus]